MKRFTRRTILAAAPSVLAVGALPARAAKQYGPGVTDTEIKIGNTCFYSGPASSYGTIGKAMAAYYKMVNDQGGVNGRKINFISYDDAYSPPKTVEQTRRLVEQDEILLDAGPLGTPTNSAIWQYMNQKKVPQLFVSTGATKWDDPKGHPWTIGWQPNYQSEGRIYAAYIMKEKPGGKIGVLYQNDDFGKDYLKGLKDGLGDRKSLVVVEASYETQDPTVDSQVISMKAAGCEVFVNTAIPKFAAQAIRRAVEIEWAPLHILSSIGNSVAATLKPAGLANAKGLVSDFYLKDPTDTRWKDDDGFKWWASFMDKYYPKATRSTLETSMVRRMPRPSFRC
jgi:branched-chain amino acid transport system substrate-binding protein